MNQGDRALLPQSTEKSPQVHPLHPPSLTEDSLACGTCKEVAVVVVVVLVVVAAVMVVVECTGSNCDL
jgi:hypothetical protein